MDVVLEHFVEHIVGNFIENSAGVGLFLYSLYFCLSFHQYYTFVSKANNSIIDS